MSVSIAQLSAGVSAHVVDCPPGVVQWALRRGVSQFLNDSGVWQITAEIAGVKDDAAFDVRDAISGDVHAGAFIRGILGVRVDGRDVSFRLRGRSADSVYLQYALIRDGAIEVDCLLGQRSSSQDMDEGIAGRYGDTICLLARSLVYSIKDRPYSNMEAARDALVEYREQLSDACMDRVRGGYGGDAVNPLPEYF